MGFLTAKWNWNTAKEVWQEEVHLNFAFFEGKEEF
ncbi:hypothetical protein R84B8_00693 [Treponema sp. R8-4-B8]